ncbi:hypothetical protein BGX29_011959 [Mortierella sp. GBA35]|nr:hypothetical protein BGX29_011959 [Mortierella sp. GBA35]
MMPRNRRPKANSQNTPPNVYRPVSYAASAVLADGYFYLYGGVIRFAPDNSANTGSNQFLKLDLTKSFDTATAPWEILPGDLTYTMLQAAPSKDGRHFVTGGNRDNFGALSRIYSIDKETWIATTALPGQVAVTGYKRTNVAMALDKVTGLLYIYGGFHYLGFSRELSVLNTSSSDATKMGWTLSKNQTAIPALYDPFAVFLPTRNKTLVFGGCDRLDPIKGVVGGCLPLSSGFLVSNGHNETQVLIENQGLNAAPFPRYQSCRVVLPDGNVFIQGGKGPDEFYADAWILNVTDWTWKTVHIDGDALEMARAGHACQLGAYGQIVVVGGYFRRGDLFTFVTPYMAVIDTGTWKWKKSYQGAPLDCIWPSPCPYVPGPDGSDPSSSSTGGLSAGAKGGIGAGVGLVILAAAVLGFIFWRRRQSSLATTTTGVKKTNNFSSSSRAMGWHDDNNALEKNRETGLGSAFSAPRGPSYASSSHPPVRAEYPQDAIVEDTERSSPIMVALPVYTGYDTTGKTPTEDEIVSSPSPVVTKKRSPFGLSKKASKPNTGGNYGGGGDGDQKDPIPFQQMLVQHVRVPSAKTNQSSTQTVSPTSLMTPSIKANRPTPTIHTLVHNNPPPSEGMPRYVPGPQSVPEHEARIERSSPGVRLRTPTVQDMGQDGFYPSPTPTRGGYGPTSFLIESSGPESPSTYVTSPLQQSSVMGGYPGGIVPISTPQPPLGSAVIGAGAAGGGGSNPSAHYGQSGDGNNYHHQEGSSGSNGGGGGGSNSNGPYRDLQMAKDLDEIARKIESQSLLEPKGPHAVVSPHDQNASQFIATYSPSF